MIGPVTRGVIAGQTGVATGLDNTNLAISPRVIRGISGESVMGGVVPAAVFIGGGNSTELASFVLDMNTGMLVMQFSQPVPPMVVSSGFKTPQFNITGGAVTATTENFEITLSLLTEDLDALNADERVAVSPSNTYLFIETVCLSRLASSLISMATK